ncbi:hydantoinase B/oxoprolinase family protein [Roseomonas sp. BN140053]|uniref:hydantoinase B/oxoprolinase family protein n=1 Tax=Roseomonas sp. BN140053 TaxID=3391898 RepID=UPI0039ED60B2
MSRNAPALEVFANHMRAAAEAMAHTLFRTAHSTFVKETEDFTAGILDAEGRTVAIPLDFGVAAYAGIDYRNVLGCIDRYEEGDICFTNDPYSGFVATHSPDIHLWKPVFHEGELVCFASGHIHNTDVGGAVPASLSRALTEVHQEGIRFPPAKLVRRGVLNDELLRVMMANVRSPAQNWGDLKAFIGAMTVGERKVKAVLSHFGLDAFRQGTAALMDYAERQARAILRGIPDGEYRFADYIDEDMPGGHPCRLALTLTIRGDEAVLDFTGSDPQLNASVNVPTGGFEQHTLILWGVYYVLCTLSPGILLNGGLVRPFRCILPEGSILNPAFPAAVGMRSLTCGRVRSLIIGAFTLAIPDRMPAASAGATTIVNVATTDERTGKRIIAAINPVVGGAGGRPHEDGSDGSGADAGYLKNTPVEINEAETPIRILRYALKPDSGGPGRHRGGLGTLLEFQVFSPGTSITARNRDRHRFEPWGILGGKAGATCDFIINPGTPGERRLGNTDFVVLAPGDIAHLYAPGGGGRGHPFEREAGRVLADIRRGFVSEAAARRDYGICLRDGQLDEAATAQLRQRMCEEAVQDHFDLGQTRRAFERVWTEEAYAALTEILATLPVHWRHFVKTSLFATVAEQGSEEGETAESVRSAFAGLARKHPVLCA